ncbi:2-succinyl-5-enolpyruvyl-6-hydroxy-3-cyclohexene-1-carboxylic-acid synthase [Leptolyngbya sp. 'hensonii']|uniref:2-succinyl-5-enolpyruvyl-6-hydroxy-3- cyclohexene-1-carboxylic-acid synthase n=1 Tax=Leptolyngbya sp. 'hensonii' TaxID=1922337 RepID=UPI0009500EA6|nr:2-succinyl-5-enolpyruvyl-6-hydroxy-3-cyclohexene-1-carboxylic-acid synthase [Leptolyngbya sp. 'hensonii']OLP16101.1 2-succinyl-5-enolpyruvyl-6-hydroxy-3-cyclohexene-1-carboxylic-acid synthase [Leptolyngbya sp. 'hensonii']
MTLDFRNTNTLWASILATTLEHLGLLQVIICPGSRSAPLTIAFTQQPNLTSIPVLDERSAAFFALGLARQSRKPVALVCTSGTAGANFYPALIEARESRVPLLVLTADRPPEARYCNAGQAIDQQKLFGHYPNWFVELALPSLDPTLLAYLRQTLVHAWERACWPVPGPVHLNIPFRDPLAPLPDPTCQAMESQFQPDLFFQGIASPHPVAPGPNEIEPSLLLQWQSCDRGLIIAGIAQPADPKTYCATLGRLSQQLGWPVLADGLSPLRNHADLNPHLITTYDLILRHGSLSVLLAPEMVLRVGEMPTSKVLRAWLEQTQPQQWVLDAGDRNLDPLHGRTVHLRMPPDSLTRLPLEPPAPLTSYLKSWQTAEAKVRQVLDATLSAESGWFEGKAAWLLSQHLPPGTPLFVANSMPIRDVDFFWPPSNTAISLFCNRGANGIDGTLSTALGIAYQQQSAVLLTGDLALLHDTNGLLLQPQLRGHLTIALINNRGGGIFESLPIARFDPPFEDFFATPQSVNFASLGAAYGVEHHIVQSWEEWINWLNPLPATGIRILELQTDRKADAQWRTTQFATLTATGLDGLASILSISTDNHCD